MPLEVLRPRLSITRSLLALCCSLTLTSVACSSDDSGPDAGGNGQAGSAAGAAAGGAGGAAAAGRGTGGAGGAGATDSGPPLVEGACQIDASKTPPSVQRIECTADFEALASEPLDDSIPGARSGKVVLDTFDNQLYFQNTNLYKIHYEFASAQLSGGDRPMVTTLADFNETQYFAPD